MGNNASNAAAFAAYGSSTIELKFSDFAQNTVSNDGAVAVLGDTVQVRPITIVHQRSASTDEPRFRHGVASCNIKINLIEVLLSRSAGSAMLVQAVLLDSAAMPVNIINYNHLALWRSFSTCLLQLVHVPPANMYALYAVSLLALISATSALHCRLKLVVAHSTTTSVARAMHSLCVQYATFFYPSLLPSFAALPAAATMCRLCYACFHHAHVEAILVGVVRGRAGNKPGCLAHQMYRLHC